MTEKHKAVAAHKQRRPDIHGRHFRLQDNFSGMFPDRLH
jgi:hypothetical protein